MKKIFYILNFILAVIFFAQSAKSFTANKVWMEFRPNGRFRVYVNYTIPALKEFREAYAEFTVKKEAEKFYYDLVRGVDFFLPDVKKREFINSPLKPQPW